MLLRLLLIVCLLVAATALGYVGWLAVQPPTVADVAPPPPAAPPARVSVLSVTKPVSVGTLLKEEDLTVQEYPADAVPEGAVIQSETARADLRGAMVRRFLDAGSPISLLDILRLRDTGYLAAVLREGYRAVSVGVDEVTGAAGLVWPGDHVDLILTQEMAAGTTTPTRRVVGETILTDVRVLAVDQKIARAGPDVVVGQLARTVTIEVTPPQAERIAVAARLGSIVLTVRASDSKPDPEGPRRPPVFAADVSAALVGQAPVTTSRMRVIQGGEQEDVVLP